MPDRGDLKVLRLDDAPPRNSPTSDATEDGPQSTAALDRSVPRVALPPPASSSGGAAVELNGDHLAHGVTLEQNRLTLYKNGFQGTSDVSTSCGGEPADKRVSVQDIVRDFVRRAMLGVPCELIDLSTGRRRNAVYSIDSALTTFEVQDSLGSSAINKQSKWPLENLHDILHAAQHPVVNARRWASLAALGSPELDRAAMIEALIDGGNRVLLMLLEENVLRRDHFVASMRVLKLYAQSATPQTTARSQHDPGSPGLANGAAEF